MMSAVSGTARRSTAQDEDAVATIMRRGGPALRGRMRHTERHLELVTAQAGVPLAAHATATVAAGGKRLRPLLVVLAWEAAGGPAVGDPAAASATSAGVADGTTGALGSGERRPGRA